MSFTLPPPTVTLAWRRRETTTIVALAAATLLAAAAVMATASLAFAQAEPQAKFCGDPTLTEDEPCLPPNWCSSPEGTFLARQDGSCHPEDLANGTPVPSPVKKLERTEFNCAKGYQQVWLDDGTPACAGDLRAPE